MSRFIDEVRLIRWPAWVAGIVLAVSIHIPIALDRRLSLPAQIALSTLCGALLLAYALLAGYVYADAKRRGMRSVMWTFLAVLVPNAIGFILYFVLRDPLLVSCPGCGARARQNLAYCPQCGAPLARCCRQCRRTVEPGWANCAYCGAKLTAA